MADDANIMADNAHITRASKTVRSMMATRGYRELVHSPIAPGHGPPMAFVDKKRCMPNIAIKWLLPNTRVGVKETRSVIEEMTKASVVHLILIVSKDVTSFACHELINCKLRIEKWIINDLQSNPLSYFLTPPHRLLTIHERRSVKVIGKLPKMLSSDAISRFYGAKKGSIFEVLRKSPDGFHYKIYRVVT